MKKLILTFALLTSLVGISNGQTKAVLDGKGNYIAVSRKDTGSNKLTGKTFTDSKGNVYPVLISKNGKLFYMKTAKTSGNVYKVYIKVN